MIKYLYFLNKHCLHCLLGKRTLILSMFRSFIFIFFATIGMNGLKLYNVSEWCTIMYNLYNSVQSVQHKPLKLRKRLNIKLPWTDRQTQAKACVRHDKLSDMFPKNMKDHLMDKRVKEVYCVKRAKIERFNNC